MAPNGHIYVADYNTGYLPVLACAGTAFTRLWHSEPISLRLVQMAGQRKLGLDLDFNLSDDSYRPPNPRGHQLRAGRFHQDQKAPYDTENSVWFRWNSRRSFPGCPVLYDRPANNVFESDADAGIDGATCGFAARHGSLKYSEPKGRLRQR